MPPALGPSPSARCSCTVPTGQPITPSAEALERVRSHRSRRRLRTWRTRARRRRRGNVRKPAIEGARAHVRVCLQRLGLRCDLRRMPSVPGAGVGVVACAQVPPKRSIGGRSAIRRTSQHNVRCRWPQSRRSTCTAAGAVQRCRERSGTACRADIVIRQVRECSVRSPCAQSKRVPTLCISGLG